MRLTKAIKDQTIKNWVESKWRKKLNAARNGFISDCVKLAEKELEDDIKLYNDNKHLSKYLNSFNYVNIWQASERINNCFYLDSVSRNLEVSRYASKNSYSALCVDNKITAAATKKYNNVIDKFHDELNSVCNVLSSVTTINKLVNILPDIEKYLPDQSSCTALVDASSLSKAKAVL